MIKGYIFDLDGTILDSLEAWDHVGQRYLQSIGIEAENNLDSIVDHMSLSQAAEYIKEEYKLKSSIEDIVQGICDQFAVKYIEDISLKNGVKSILKDCQKKGYQIAIFTAGDRDLAIKALNRLQVLDYFDEIYTCQSIGYSKQDVQSYQTVAEKINLEIEECVVVEDALYAVETAIQAGFHVKAIYDKANQKDWEKICQIATHYYKELTKMEV